MNPLLVKDSGNRTVGLKDQFPKVLSRKKSDKMSTFKRIELADWRQFKKVSINLDSDVTVITGPNGCGKTTILNVLAHHFGWNINFVSASREGKKYKKVWTDVWKILNSEKTEASVERTEVGSILYSNEAICKLVVPVQSAAQYRLEYSMPLTLKGLNIPSHRPVMGYFQVNNIPTNPKTKQQQHAFFQQMLFQAYGSSNAQNPGVALKESLISLAVFGTGNKYVEPNPEFRDLFEGFQEILKIVLPKAIGFQRLLIRSPEIILITDSGDFPLDAMSGGVSAIFVMAWQIHMFGSGTEGNTVIIDEPENHLHPSMQREFLALLRKAFPAYKFIVSTHSPFIVSSDPDASVYALLYDEEKRISSKKLEHADLAGSPNKILREIMDVPTTLPLWVEEEIKRVLDDFEGASNNKEKAKAILEELKKLGLSDSLSEFGK